ncbi:MAG TPA: 50S ribosomal protein L25 [Bdellovibrionota bacterium]|nr:50S ribosomal protein L25 [Bdellovibrionota bacterium]
MAKELVKLSARERELAGKSVLRKHRREGRLPAILYGKKMKTTLPLTVLPLELEKILKTKGENAIITLEGLGSTKTAILRDIQRHPVTDRCLHADFVEVDLTVELEVDVPFEFTGEPIGVKDEGGILQIARREAKIKCLPHDIPENIIIDVSQLGMHDSIHIQDLRIDPKLKLVFDSNYTIASVVPPQKDEPTPVAAPAEGEAAAATEGEGATKEAKAPEGQEQGKKEEAKKEEKAPSKKETPKK